MRKVLRPWGWYIVLAGSYAGWWLKLLKVDGRTSLQSHAGRTEIHLGRKGINIIRPKEKHRLTKGLYLEFAYGFPMEYDIVRYEDDYGRI